MMRYSRRRGQAPPSRLDDLASREKKALKIGAILRAAELDDEDTAAMTCLDVGCANGTISRLLAPRFKRMIGLEYEEGALIPPWDAEAGVPWPDNLLLARGDAVHLPLPDQAVDLVICAQVYEHVYDADAMAAEIWRVLVPGGVCFFSGPNRLSVIEPHCFLPFISWLPRSWANAYIRLAGRGSHYDETSRTWWGLKRLWRAFDVVDHTYAMLVNPAAFHCGDESAAMAWVGRLPEWLLRALTPLYPNYNWVLYKPGEAHLR